MAIDIGRITYEAFHKHIRDCFIPWEDNPPEYKDAWRAAGVAAMACSSCIEAEKIIVYLKAENARLRDELEDTQDHFYDL